MDRNISKMLFIFHHSMQHEASGYTVYKEKKHLLGNNFGSLYTSNRIYLLQICFSNYVYLKDMHITLKGIGKILFVSVLRTLLICKFLNFTAAFTKKKLNFPKFAFNFPCEKVNFSLIHRTHITIQSYIQTNSKNSHYQIFLIYKTSPIHMSCSRTRTDSCWNTCPEF